MLPLAKNRKSVLGRGHIPQGRGHILKKLKFTFFRPHTCILKFLNILDKF